MSDHSLDVIRFDKGTDQMDEVWLTNVDVHIEQMDNNYYFLAFTRHGSGGADRLAIDLGAFKKRSNAVNGVVHENDMGVREAR